MELGMLKRAKPEFKENDMVCYCFEYTRKEIETDYLANGYSTIMEQIKHEKKIGGCQCADKNPKGG